MSAQVIDSDLQTSILSRLVRPSDPDLARHFLAFDFTPEEKLRVAELSQRADNGALDADERRELEDFVRLNFVFGNLRSQARIVLGKPLADGD